MPKTSSVSVALRDTAPAMQRGVIDPKSAMRIRLVFQSTRNLDWGRVNNPLVESRFTRLGHVFLTGQHHLGLVGDLLQLAQHVLVAVDESENQILNLGLLAEILDECL
jgi:hypothetical protein